MVKIKVQKEQLQAQEKITKDFSGTTNNNRKSYCLVQETRN